MKKEEIHFDVLRILFGQTPPVFLAEVLIRGIITFIILMIAIRLMGKRMAAQQTFSEMIVVLMLGAAIGVPIQDPGRGLLQGILILIIVVAFQKGITLWAFKKKNVEYITQGDVELLIEDGVLDTKKLTGLGFTRDRLLGELRDMNVQHLGQVERLYIESSGDFSLYKFEKPRAGLSILPDFDEEIRKEQKVSRGEYVCFSCGNFKKVAALPKQHCEICGSPKWTEAVHDELVTSPTPDLPVIV